MNQNLSKSNFLHESSKLEHFRWGVKILGGTNLGGSNNLDLSKVEVFNNYHICNILD